MKNTVIGLVKVSILLISLLAFIENREQVFASASSDTFSDVEMEVSTKEGIENNIEMMFSELNDSDMVLALPNGGFLHGESELLDENQNILTVYNSETDPNSITVSLAKELMVEQALEENSQKKNYLDLINPTIQGTAPPSTTSYLVLGVNETYNSSTFSGSGWRFAGYWFYNHYKASNGNYYAQGPLKWKTFVDSGAVGDAEDVNNIYANHWASAGIAIYPNQNWKLVSSGNPGNPKLTYFTYSPISGTTYSVMGSGLSS